MNLQWVMESVEMEVSSKEHVFKNLGHGGSIIRDRSCQGGRIQRALLGFSPYS